MINYRILIQALDYYQSMGFTHKEVDWLVEESIANITKPDFVRNFYIDDKALVGSAEQSFLQMITHNELPPGQYVALTPCFRDDVEDLTHKRYFMKVELIDTLNTSEERLNEIVNICVDFFKQFTDVRIEKTGDLMYDIVDAKTGIELGSYGIRHHQSVNTWIYATGVAEPRLSTVIDLNNGVSKL
jgi:seryl-tRNA synthetase